MTMDYSPWSEREIWPFLKVAIIMLYVLFKLINYMLLLMLSLFLFPLQLLKFRRLKTLNLSHNTDIAIDPKTLSTFGKKRESEEVRKRGRGVAR